MAPDTTPVLSGGCVGSDAWKARLRRSETSPVFFLRWRGHRRRSEPNAFCVQGFLVSLFQFPKLISMGHFSLWGSIVRVCVQQLLGSMGSIVRVFVLHLYVGLLTGVKVRLH